MSLSLRYLRGRVFVLEMLPGSQAQVDRFLSPGDVIDEINGVSLRNSRIGQVRRRRLVLYFKCLMIVLRTRLLYVGGRNLRHKVKYEDIAACNNGQTSIDTYAMFTTVCECELGHW